MNKKIVLFSLILIIPLLFVVSVNEYSRLNNSNKGFVRKGIIAINPSIKTPEKWTTQQIWYKF